MHASSNHAHRVTAAGGIADIIATAARVPATLVREVVRRRDAARRSRGWRPWTTTCSATWASHGRTSSGWCATAAADRPCPGLGGGLLAAAEAVHVERGLADIGVREPHTERGHHPLSREDDGVADRLGRAAVEPDRVGEVRARPSSGRPGPCRRGRRRSCRRRSGRRRPCRRRSGRRRARART